MQIVSIGDNLHKVSKPVFFYIIFLLETKKKIYVKEKKQQETVLKIMHN